MTCRIVLHSSEARKNRTFFKLQWRYFESVCRCIVIKLIARIKYIDKKGHSVSYQSSNGNVLSFF